MEGVDIACRRNLTVKARTLVASLNGITSRAIQWSRPGRWSWLALLLFIGSLLVAVQFRGSIVEQMQYREHFGDAASLATLNNIILGFSTALVVAAAVISWRVWWTFSLIGTTTPFN